MDGGAASTERGLIEALAFGVVLLDAVRDAAAEATDFRVRAVNAAALKALGLPRQPQAGAPLAAALPMLAAPEALAALRRAHLKTKTVRFALGLAELEARPQGGGLAVTVRRSATADDTALRDRLELATAANGIGIWELLPQQDRLMWNAPMFTLFGVDPADFGGRLADWAARVHPDDLPEAMAAFRDLLGRDGDSGYMFRIVRPDGSVRRILARARVVERDADGTALRVVGINQDITDQQSALDRAAAAEARLLAAVEALPDGFVIYDADDRLVLCNSRYREIYAESAPSMTPGARFVDIIRYGLAHGQYPEAEGREEAFVADRLALHADASRDVVQGLPGNRWVQVVERRTTGGDTVGFRVDITRLKRQQQQLEALADRVGATNREMETFLSIAQDMLTVTDADGKILRANEAWRTVLGLDPQALVGRRHVYDLHPEDLGRSAAVAQTLRQKGRIGPELFRCRDGDGAWRWLEWHAVRAPDGLIYSAARDVTGRETELLRRALKTAEEEVLSAVMTEALAADSEAGFMAGALGALLDGRPWTASVRGASCLLGGDAPGCSLSLVASRGEIGDPGAVCACVASGRCLCADAADPGAYCRCLAAVAGRSDVLCVPVRLGQELAGALQVFGAADATQAGLTAEFLGRLSDALALGLANRRAARLAGQERAAALAAAAELSSYQSAILQHMIVLETDPDGRITQVNGHFEALTGYGADALIGRTPRILNSGHHPPEHFAQMWRTIKAGQSWKGENCNRAADGSIFWIQSTIIPVLGKDGTIARFVAIIVDITERKRLAETLQATNTHLARVTEISGIGGWERDIIRGAVQWDDKVREIYELPESYDVPAERLVHEFYPPEARGLVADAARGCLEEGRPFDLEVPFVTAKGRNIWIRTVGDPKIVDGRIVGMVGAVQDITERKNREIETEQLRGRFEAIFENTGSLIFLKDREGRFISANRRFREQVGRDRVEGLTDFDLTEAAIAQELDTRDRAVFDTGQPLLTEETVRRPDGSLHHFVSSKFLIDDPRLGDKVMVAISTDVTELKRRDAENARLRARFDAFMENTDAMIFLKRRDGTYITCNRSVLDMLGLDGVDQVAGCTLETFFDTGDAAAMKAVEARIFETGRPEVEEQCLLLQGEQRHFLTSLFLIPDAAEADTVLCGVSTEITELKRLQASLEASRREAEAASQAKSQFLATMSHEIRTPMNGVIGMAEMLARTITDPEQKGMLAVIRESGEMLMTVINDVLDFSKIEVGKLDLEHAPFSLREVLRKVESVHALKASEKGLTMKVRVDPGLAAPRLGDAHRLQQVLHNLVGNAIKFTERGGVTIAVAAEPDGGVRIEVADTGVGMTEAQIGRVFEEFAQADSSTTRRYGGTGLGLPIVKGLVEAMGGTVAVRSRPGEGSCFTLGLPLPLAEPDTQAPVPAPAAMPLRALRVLAADDNEVNRMVLAAFLETLGVSVTMVEGGAEAVAARATAPFDALMLDIAMPGMDGVEALAAIRARETALGLPHLPAVAVTANAMQHQIEEYRAAGFDLHLAKPLSLEALSACLDTLAALRAAPVSG